MTHSLANLELYDTVLVLDAGRVVYHGPPRALEHYFSVEQAEDVYPQLAKRGVDDWAASWDKYRDSYYESLPTAPTGDPDMSVSAITPGAMAQFFALFFRRWKIFFRDWGNLILQFAILVGFPVLVVIFETRRYRTDPTTVGNATQQSRRLRARTGGNDLQPQPGWNRLWTRHVPGDPAYPDGLEQLGTRNRGGAPDL